MKPCHWSLAALCVLFVTGMPACGAVYPELFTPVRPAPPGKPADPPPPPDLFYVDFRGAEIPQTTQDGRKWDSLGGAAPDAFAKLLMDGREIIRTPTQPNTLRPTWPDQRRANYVIQPGRRIAVELWDSNPINNHPICTERLDRFHDEVERGEVEIRCASGARLTLTIEPARAKLGLGMYYELRNDEVYVTRVIRHSPASRAGLRAGDRILKIQGRNVTEMDHAEVKTLVNANVRSGLALDVQHADGRMVQANLKEGPMYPVLGEEVTLP
jgi:hypothetical protein